MPQIETLAPKIVRTPLVMKDHTVIDNTSATEDTAFVQPPGEGPMNLFSKLHKAGISGHCNGMPAAEEEPQGVEASPPEKEVASPSLYDRASDLGNWLWSVFFGSSDGTKESSGDNIGGPQTAKERVAAMRAVSRMVEQMRAANKDLKVIIEEEIGTLNFEKLVAKLLLELREDKQDEISLHQETIMKAQSERKELTKKRLEEFDQSIKNSTSKHLWGMFEKGAAAFGTAAAALGATTPVGMVLFVVALGFHADQLMGDPAKKAAASGLATLIGGGEETKSKALDWLQLGLGVTTLAIGFVATGGGLLRAAASIAKGSTQIASGAVRHNANLHTAQATETKEKYDKNNDKMKSGVNGAKELVVKIFEHMEHLIRIERSRHSARSQVAANRKY